MVNESRRIKAQIFGRELEIETGRLAKQSHGAVLARYEGTAVLATVVAANEKSPVTSISRTKPAGHSRTQVRFARNDNPGLH